MIDFLTPFGQRVQRRLEKERIIWLTTTSQDGTPQPRPVWFLWTGDSFLIYSRPDTAKLRHIQARPSVSLNFDGDGFGGDIVVFTGSATIDKEAPPADQMSAYCEKYGEGFQRINVSAAGFAAMYTVAVRVYPHQLRGH